MNKSNQIIKKCLLSNQSGGVLILVALTLIVLLGVAAFAIDIGHLMVVRNELRNAADAGALAGARMLYTSVTPSLMVSTNSNTVAYNAATANASDNSPVEIHAGNIQRGHWCFSCTEDGEQGVFTPNNSQEPYNFVGMSTEALDTDTDYINAVRVVASRGPSVSAASFFGGIFMPEGNSPLNAEAVAWVGPAGSNIHVDQPVAICMEKVSNPDGSLNCTTGTMINSSGSETGAWTNLDQSEDCCTGTAPVPELKPLVDEGCENGEIPGITIQSGLLMTVDNGEKEAVFNDVFNCWMKKLSLDSDNDKMPDSTWPITLPLIECGNTPPTTCKIVRGAVNVEVYWIIEKNDPDFKDIPTEYDLDPATPGMEYNCMATDPEGRKQCWADFLNAFDVNDSGGNDLTADTAAALHVKKSIYFKPNCTIYAEGSSGGAAANVVAKYPKLVR